MFVIELRLHVCVSTVKPVLNSHYQKDKKLVLKTVYHLMQVKSIAEWSILQYFRPSLSYHLTSRSLFCLFLRGRLRQVLLYTSDLNTLCMQAVNAGETS